MVHLFSRLNRILPHALGVMALLCATTFAQAQAPQGEGMQVRIPPGWKLLDHQTSPQLDYVWYGPAQEREKPIQDLLLYQDIKFPKGLGVDQVIEGLLNDTQRNCPNLTTGNIQMGEMNGYAAAFVVVTCPQYVGSNGGRVSLVLTIGGRDSVYQVQRVWNTPPFQPGTSPIVSAQVDTWTTFLANLKVCDTRYPLQHPCGEAAPAPQPRPVQPQAPDNDMGMEAMPDADERFLPVQ